MKTHSFIVSTAVLILLTWLTSVQPGAAQGTAFTYQGRLNVSGSPANGLYDFTFELSANAQGSIITASTGTLGVPVTNGLFTTAIDFGAGQFIGTSNWLVIEVRTNLTGSYVTLSPLQLITPTPYSIFANTASNLSGTITAAHLAGAISLAQLPTAAVTNNNVTSVSLLGVFTGNGGGLTNLNASQLMSGVIPTNVLPGFQGPGYNTIGGGSNNADGGSLGFDTIGGGASNTVAYAYATVGGGQGNVASGEWATIAGGQNNLADNFLDFVGGGQGNTAEGGHSVVGGGFGNTATFLGATVAGGLSNSATYYFAAVGGGSNNLASGNAAVVAGGVGNTATNNDSTVAGGINNTASGNYATVPGGSNNVASGNYSFAAGQQAQSVNQGTFVWADSQNSPFTSLNNNTFNVRANGGVRILTSGAGMTLDGEGVLTVLTNNLGSGTITFSNIVILGTMYLPTAFEFSNGRFPQMIISNSSVFFGPEDGESNTATGNAGFGTEALQDNGSGFNGTAVGYFALNNNVNGDNNTAIGTSTLGSNIGGNNNTAVGSTSLGDNVSGNNNTAIGFQTLAQGGFYGAGNSNNIVMGVNGLYNNLSGNNNTAIGTSALGNSTNSINIIALGYQAGTNFTGSESNDIDIGNTGVAGENDVIRIGTPGVQTNTFIAGVINGNGGGLTNLPVGDLAGIISTGNLPNFQGPNYNSIGGGSGNSASGTNSTIGGGVSNTVAYAYSTVGGGTNNAATGEYSTIAGGENNLANNFDDAVGGGQNDSATGGHSYIGGGQSNSASYLGTAIVGGVQNSATYSYAFVGGGFNNLASSNAAVVAGGQGNTASGNYATVPGGSNNVASGSMAFAAGQNARATNNNSFVWSDGSSTAGSGTNNSVTMQATNGLRFFTGGNGSIIFTNVNSSGSDQQVAWTPGSGSWTFTSDRNTKDRFESVDAESVLARVMQLPISEWSYKGFDQRHIGAMAQDFHAQFPLNGNDKALNDADLHGVELAAIQGLNQKLEEQANEAKAKDAEIDNLQKQLSELEAVVKSLQK